MNALCYKIVFSKRLGTLVAVGEHTVGQGKTASGSGVRNVVSGAIRSFIGALNAVFAAVALTFLTASFTASVSQAAGPAATALPTGASVNSGNVAISSTSSSSAATMTITQASDKASVNWQSFNIGSAARVNVQQNSANSVLLNRVVGNDPSQIFGKLSANGQVILINPNGIVFGSGGSVSASAFTASTFGVSEQDFASGKYKYNRSASTAGITIEEGATLNATAPGGYIALIGASVDNQGRISTQQGAVVMAAGENIALPAGLTDNISVPLSGKVRLELLPSALNAMVSNSGTITTEGGQVLMQAAALSDAVASVTHAGTIDTTGGQGGAVSLLADHGIIKVSGSITANSTGKDEQGHQRKGGDIVIGRDEETGVLAHVTDVHGGKLESLGGFVETSGDYLKTDGISVKAKDWLLDPTDINIVAVGTATPDTATVPGSNLYQDTTGVSTSEVLTGTIQTAINNGTNVTISTANSAVGANGSGNITIVNKLDFANNSGQDATLTLLAKNGITQNAGATIIQTTGANNNKVDVIMTSEGLHMGAPSSSASSKGITLNAAINTNGDVTLNGKTNNSGAASASNAIGVDIKSTAAITAKNISITGKSESSFGIQSASVLNATGIATLDGTSKNWVGVVTTGAVTAGGALAIIGHKTTAAGYQGININSALKGASVAISGDSVDHYGVNVNASGTVTSTTGDITIIGTGTGASASNNAVGAQIQGAITAKGKLTISGTKDGNTAGYQGANISANLTGNGIEVTGISNSWDALQFNNNVTVDSQSNILKVTGNSTVAKGLFFTGTNTFNADNYSIKGTGANNYAIYFGGNSTFNSTSTVTPSLIEATRTTSNGDAIFNAGTLNLNSGAGKTSLQTSTGNVGGGIRINGGSTVNTTGDVTIGSKNSSNAYTFNQGTINALSGNLTIKGQSAVSAVFLQDSGGTGAKIIGTNGANITIDGTSTGSGTGVNLSVNNSANTISTSTTPGGAAGLISITGVSATGSGIYQSASTTITNTSGAITMTGTSSGGTGLGLYNIGGSVTSSGALTLEGNSSGGNGVYATGAFESTGGSVKLTGTSSTSSALSLQGNIKAYQDVEIVGKNTSALNGTAVAYLNKNVTATNGKIDITTSTLGTTFNALQLASGANLSAKTAVNIKTDTLSIDTSVTPATISAPTGTVTIKTDSAAAKINIGSGDTGSATAGSRVLGLSNAELNRISASELVIGDANNTGGLAVSAATTTNTASGNLTLETSGGMSITGALTAGNSTLKNITLLAKSSGTGLLHNAMVKGENITMLAESTATTGNILGYYGAGSGAQFEATNSLNLTGVTASQGNGFYSFGGTYTAGTGITINGTSANGQGVGLDKSVNITNTVGDIIITGTASNTSNNTATTGVHTEGIGLRGSKITNNGGSTRLTAVNGNVLTGPGPWTGSIPNEIINSSTSTGIIQIAAGNAYASNSGGVDGTALTITQNGNSGVLVSSSGTGNVTAPKIVNAGPGDVVIAAGTKIAAGDGSGGQLKMVSGNTITQNSSGKTYLYTGNANHTGALSTISGFTNGLFLSTIGTDTVNAASNTAYETSGTRNTISGGANTQVVFREKVTLSGALNSATVTYGDNTSSAAVKTALQAANTGASNVVSTASNAGTFKILNADLIADMATGKPSVDTALSLATNKSTSGNLKANNDGYGIDISGTKYTLNTTAKLVVGQKSISALYAANDKVYDGNNSATVVGSLQNTITGDLVNPTHTGATFDTFAVGTNKTVTVTGISLSGVDLANYKIDPLANPTFTATARAAITPSAPPPPAPVVPTNATSGRVKIPLSAANPFQLASAEELVEEDFCSDGSTGNSNSNCTCEESKLAQDSQICFEKTTDKVFVQ